MISTEPIISSKGETLIYSSSALDELFSVSIKSSNSLNGQNDNIIGLLHELNKHREEHKHNL